MSRETIKTLFTLEGLLLLTVFLIGYFNNELWLSGVYYFCLPLFIIVGIVSFSSIFSKHTESYRGKVLKLFWFNVIGIILLAFFVWWALGGGS